MKRLTLIGVLGVLVATGAAFARSDAPNDGTLTVTGAVGRIVITGRGGVIGRFDRGQVTIRDPIAADGTGPIVTGADAIRDINETTTRYSGSDVRFRIIGGTFSVLVVGWNIDASARGKGVVTLVGRGTADDGTYSLNDGPPQAIPDFPLTVPLVGPPPPPRDKDKDKVGGG